MNRRDFLGGVAAPFALAPRSQVEAPRSPGRIKITDVRVVPLRIAKQIGTLEPAWALGRTMNYAHSASLHLLGVGKSVWGLETGKDKTAVVDQGSRQGAKAQRGGRKGARLVGVRGA